MPSLIDRITRFSRSEQGRSLMRQVQAQLSSRGRSSGGRRAKKRR